MSNYSPIQTIQSMVEDFYNHFYIKNKAKKPLPSQTILKIVEEFGELAETISKDWDIKEQEKEFGDTLVTLLMHGINSNYNIQRVSDYIVEKLNNRKLMCTVVNGLIVKQADIRKKYGITQEQQ